MNNMNSSNHTESTLTLELHKHMLLRWDQAIRVLCCSFGSRSQNQKKLNNVFLAGNEIYLCYQTLFCQIPRDILTNLGSIWRTFRYHAVFGREVSDDIFIMQCSISNRTMVMPNKSYSFTKTRFDWPDFEMPCLLLKTGLTGVILKYNFRCYYSSLIIS